MTYTELWPHWIIAFHEQTTPIFTCCGLWKLIIFLKNWEMAVAITCGYGGYLLPLLAAHSSCYLTLYLLGPLVNKKLLLPALSVDVAMSVVGACWPYSGDRQLDNRQVLQAINTKTSTHGANTCSDFSNCTAATKFLAQYSNGCKTAATPVY